MVWGIYLLAAIAIVVIFALFLAKGNAAVNDSVDTMQEVREVINTLLIECIDMQLHSITEFRQTLCVVYSWVLLPLFVLVMVLSAVSIAVLGILSLISTGELPFDHVILFFSVSRLGILM